MSEGFDPREPKREKKLAWGAFAVVGTAMFGLYVLPTAADKAIAPISTGVDATELSFDWGGVIRAEHNAFYDVPDFQEVNRSVVTGALTSGDTLSDLFERLGASRADAYQAIEAATAVLDPRRLRTGAQATLFLEAGEDPEAAATLTGFTMKTAMDKTVMVAADENGVFTARELPATIRTELALVEGDIQTSLHSAVRAAGGGDEQVVEFAQIFAYDVDFQRGIRAGDRFEILYERRVDERGGQIGSGNILYAELNADALSKAFYRFTPSDDGIADYFNENGESATKFLMKTPVNGARLSSGYGMRRHPILGYNRMHQGTDFAAPTGTPIMAAGNGTVVAAKWYGGYGRYIKLRHANGYETAYAHLSRFADGVTKGARVRQGQTIGYVGNTGRSTGPHLHYEVLINGKHVNPMTLKLPTGRKLDGEMRREFFDVRDAINQTRTTAPRFTPALIADNDGLPGSAG